ncbi:MAG TPA: MauE/DoxX family redox-associated membrane protein [Pyrinomonadaceae bacterium]|jgi:peroxiredoxin|nr:MauE/DoxX family redox-associated membrane protein [Pyrinomonadaceae bacterium]
MLLTIVLLRIALSAIFSVAGVTKLIDQGGTRDAVKNFGAPEPLAPALAIALPIVELLIAAGLLVATTTSASALAALLVLSLFIVAIGVNLARGHTHDCHCFGQLYSRPLGWPTLARNVVFALGATFVLWQTAAEPASSILETLAQLNSFQGLLLVVAVVVVVASLIYLQRRQKHRAVETPAPPKGLSLDSPAPPFELTAYAGGTISLKQLLAYDKPVLLIFTNPTCGPCVVLFAEVKEWQKTHSDQLTIALISFGSIKENFVNVARNGLGKVLLQHEREVAEQYGANVTPTAVVVGRNGKIASPLAAGADKIRALLTTVVEQSHNWSR